MSKKSKTPSSKSQPKRGGSSKKSRPIGLSDTTLAILLALFGILLYANTLNHGYVLDDDQIFAANENVLNGLAGLFDIFTQPYRDNCLGGCLYRPLALTTFAIDWMIAPGEPMFGHLVNILWYAATGILLFYTLRRLLPHQSSLFPLMASALFLAHPIHTEVVANIKSRDEILSLFFVVLSVGQYAKWHITGQWKSMLFAGLAFFAALLSKEGAITMVAVFPLMGWIFFQKPFWSSLKSGWWALVPVVLFFLLRGTALQGLTSPDIHMFDNPLVKAEGTERFGTAFFILLKYLQLLVFPFPLICDYSYNAVPLKPLTHWTSLLGMLVYIGIGVYSLLGLVGKRIGGFFTSAYLFTISLYSQLVFLIGTLIGERLLYLPSLWFVLFVTTILLGHLHPDPASPSPLFQWNRASTLQRSLLIGFAGVLIVCSVQTVLRNRAWASDYTLMETDAKKSPNSIRLIEGYAEEIYKTISVGEITPEELKRRLDLSEQYSQKAIAIEPGIAAYTNMANISLNRKDYPLALDYYKKILVISEDKELAEHNIANMLIYWAKQEADVNNNISASIDLLNQAIEYHPEDGEIWHGIGLNKYRLGNLVEARIALEKAYSLSPGNATIRTDLANFYRSQGLNDKAEAIR